MSLNLIEAAKTIAEFSEDKREIFSENEKQAFDTAISVLSCWDEVQERLLLSLYKVTGNDGYIRGIRHSLALINSIFEARMQELSISRMEDLK